MKMSMYALLATTRKLKKSASNVCCLFCESKKLAQKRENRDNLMKMSKSSPRTTAVPLSLSSPSSIATNSSSSKNEGNLVLLQKK